MANHGKAGVALEAYKARRNRSRKALVADPKSGWVWASVMPHKQKPSYIKRAERRAKGKAV